MKRRSQSRQLLVLAALLAVLLLLLWWRGRAPAPFPSPPPVVVAPLPAPATVTAPAAAIPGVPPLPALLHRSVRSLPQRPGDAALGRRLVMPRLALPDVPAVDLYRELLPAAEAGDDTAAYALARLLADCNTVPVDEQTMEQTIADVRRTHWHIDTAVRYPEQFATDLRRQYRHCAGLDAGQRASYHEWLLHAADDGQLDALENFELFDPPGNICRQYVFAKCTPEQQAASRAARQVIAHYLLAARDAGSLNALWQLGGAYLDGELFPVDRVSAFANLLAYERAASVFGLRDSVARMVRDLRGQLGPGDRAAAADQARAILANPRCCVLIQ